MRQSSSCEGTLLSTNNHNITRSSKSFVPSFKYHNNLTQAAKYHQALLGIKLFTSLPFRPFLVHRPLVFRCQYNRHHDGTLEGQRHCSTLARCYSRRCKP